MTRKEDYLSPADFEKVTHGLLSPLEGWWAADLVLGGVPGLLLCSVINAASRSSNPHPDAKPHRAGVWQDAGGVQGPACLAADPGQEAGRPVVGNGTSSRSASRRRVSGTAIPTFLPASVSASMPSLCGAM